MLSFRIRHACPGAGDGALSSLPEPNPPRLSRAVPIILFAVQLGFNAAWSPLFFGLRRPGFAFADIVLLWLALAATVYVFLRRRLAAGLLLVPYLLWVSFAAALNLAIWRLNA